MERMDDVEKMGITKISEKETHQPSNYRNGGGLRTMPFIIVNEAFERVASQGLSSNMVFYLRDVYGIKIASASIILNLWSGASNVLAIFGADLADSYLGRFWVVVLGSFCTLFGMTLLWLTAMIPQLKPSFCSLSGTLCDSASPYQLAVLFLSFGLMSIGAGCIRPCSMAFGADQITNEENPNNESVLDTYFNWYYASVGISTFIALTLIVYIQDKFGWKIGFAVPAALMLFSAVVFVVGSSLYVKVKPTQSLLIGFIQVIVVAFKNRRLNPPHSNFDQYYHGCDPMILVPTDYMRCLNKACLIMEAENNLNPDGLVSNPWKLCSVSQVESLKAFLRIIPIWSTGILMLVCLSLGSFGTLQAQIMNRHVTSSFTIPAGSVAASLIVSLTIWISFYDLILVPLLARCGQAGGLSAKTRMGIGLILSSLSMAISAVVEASRRRIAIESGFEDQPNAVVDMSALWMLPQFAVLGVAEALSSVGQIEFFYSQFPKTMSSIAVALYSLEMAVAAVVGSVLVRVVTDVTGEGNKISWLDNNFNKGHLDYFYWLCAALTLMNFFCYLLCCWSYGSFEKRQVSASNEVGDFEYRNLPSS